VRPHAVAVGIILTRAAAETDRRGGDMALVLFDLLHLRRKEHRIFPLCDGIYITTAAHGTVDLEVRAYGRRPVLQSESGEYPSR